MSNAIVSTNPPSYGTSPGAAQALSMTPAGFTRVQLGDGSGNDASSTHPIPTTGAPITTAAALTNNVVAAAGRSILITASVIGTVTLTLSGSGTVVVNPQVGDNIYPFAVTKYVTGTATITAVYNLS
jgi:hypothetical protein